MIPCPEEKEHQVIAISATVNLREIQIRPTRNLNTLVGIALVQDSGTDFDLMFHQ